MKRQSKNIKLGDTDNMPNFETCFANLSMSAIWSFETCSQTCRCRQYEILNRVRKLVDADNMPNYETCFAPEPIIAIVYVFYTKYVFYRVFKKIPK